MSGNQTMAVNINGQFYCTRRAGAIAFCAWQLPTLLRQGCLVFPIAHRA